MSLIIESKVNLEPFNTFKLKSWARFLVRINGVNDIKALLSHPVYKENKHLILGGGSNILLLSDFDGLVIKTEQKDLKVIHENEDEINIEVASGMGWHDLVTTCLANNWGGIENLSLIPGTVGAAPIQNIGAYGVEVKNVIRNVSGVDLTTGKFRTLSNSDCQFSYRDSVFKHDLKDFFFISSVTLRLTNKNHQINYAYDALKQHLYHSSIINPTINDIAEAVVKVRQSKLPDPAIDGNAGSFFKNPVVSTHQADSLKLKWPSIPLYPFEYQSFKVPAGWLIEKCGWKGRKVGNVGVHEQQALVIVNQSHASGEEIFHLSEKICEDVKEKFGITLTREVNVIR